MTPDEVIDLRKSWLTRPYSRLIPEATVLAERDWLTYVQAMAAAIPAASNLVEPSEQDVQWSWRDGVVIVLADAITLEHEILKGRSPTDFTRDTESHQVRGVVITAPQLFDSMEEDGSAGPPVRSYPVIWIGEDPTDTVEGHWAPGVEMETREYHISQSTRFLMSAITALGHRLTRHAEPVASGRGERRRIARDLPTLRVLELSSGASVKTTDEPHKVEWSHRWMVRGHWRLQPYGAGGKLRRLQWVDPYVKGPEDKPLDVRPTIWRTGHATPEATS